MDRSFKRHRASLSDSANNINNVSFGGGDSDENERPRTFTSVVSAVCNNNNIHHHRHDSLPSSRTGSPIPMSLNLGSLNNDSNHQQQPHHLGPFLSSRQNHNNSLPGSNRTSPIPVYHQHSSHNSHNNINNVMLGSSSASKSSRFLQHERTNSAGAGREIEPDTPTTARLSRHVPNRDAMDLTLSSFNLAGGCNNNNNNNHGMMMSAAMDENDCSIHQLNGSGMMLLDDDDASSNASTSNLAASHNNNNNNNNNHHHHMMRMPSDSEDSFLAYRDNLAQGLVGGGGAGSDVLRFNTASSSQQQHHQHHRNNSNNNAGMPQFTMNGGPSVSPTPSVIMSVAATTSTSTSAVGGAPSAAVRSSASRHRNDDHYLVGGGGGSSSSSTGGFRSAATGGRSASSSTHRGAGGDGLSSSSSSYHQRPLHLNPDKVLDAPDLPTEPCDLLDWGASNKLVIGLRSTLYVWDAGDGSARSVTEINENHILTGVKWLKSSGGGGAGTAAMCISKARIALTDVTTGTIARTLLPAMDLGIDSSSSSSSCLMFNQNQHDDAVVIDQSHRIVTSMSVWGPLVAAATSLGTVCLYDVRAPNMVGRFDAHHGSSSSSSSHSSSSGLIALAPNESLNNQGRLRAAAAAAQGRSGARAGGVSKAVFCSSEPHYLATGGAGDGSVRLWDYRNTAVPRYSFDGVFSTALSAAPSCAVSALCFFSDKRSIVYAGGSDGTLLALNTHGTAEDFIVSRAYGGPAPITGIVSPSGTGEIATSHGTGFGMPTASATNNGGTNNGGGSSTSIQQPTMNGGVVQLRRAYKFQLLGQFSGPGTTAGINCLTLAPDGERVCGAQLDETLKFWKVFQRRPLIPMSTSSQQQQPTSTSSQQQQQQQQSSVSTPGGGQMRIRQRQDDEDDVLSVDLR